MRPILWLIVAGLLTACSSAAPLQTDQLHLPGEFATPLPDLTLVRRVSVPRSTASVLQVYGAEFNTEADRDSQFGAPGEVADTGCITRGLTAQLPGTILVPTAEFWAAIGPREEIRLADVLTDPAFRHMGVDQLIVAEAGSSRTNVFALEAVIEGGYSSEWDTSASAISIDVGSGALTDGDFAVAHTIAAFGHLLFVLPLVVRSYPEEDPCERVGAAIGSDLSRRAPPAPARVLVLASREEPFAAAKALLSKQLPADVSGPTP